MQQLHLEFGGKDIVKKQLIIHIGMHKTGSSSLQRFLSRNRIVLRALGIHYPLSYGADGHRQSKHNALFTAISHESDRGENHPVLGPSSRMVETLIRQIQDSRCQTTILSAEGFSGPRPDFAQGFAPFAEKFDVKIIVYLRRHDLWVESFYKQMVLSREVRETATFGEFLEAKSTQRHLRYADILAYWAEAFGEKAIKVIPFEPALGGDGPVAAFLAASDLSKRLMWLPHSKEHVNRGPSAELIELVRIANEQNLSFDHRTLPAVDSQIPESSGSYFTLSERSKMIASMKSDAETVFMRYDCGSERTLFMQHEKIGASRQISWMESGCPIVAATFLPKLRQNYDLDN